MNNYKFYERVYPENFLTIACGFQLHIKSSSHCENIRKKFYSFCSLTKELFLMLIRKQLFQAIASIILKKCLPIAMLEKLVCSIN